jgi:hypothetical protein
MVTNHSISLLALSLELKINRNHDAKGYFTMASNG